MHPVQCDWGGGEQSGEEALICIVVTEYSGSAAWNKLYLQGRSGSLQAAATSCTLLDSVAAE